MFEKRIELKNYKRHTTGSKKAMNSNKTGDCESFQAERRWNF